MIEKLLPKEIQKFIQDHLNDDPVSLMLQAGKYPHLPMKEVAGQIKARQKLKKKLPDWIQNEKLIFPASLSRQQSSSQKTAIFKSKIISGDKVTDLTGGAGVDSFYLSKAFKEVHYVEPDEDLFKITQHNLTVLGGLNIKFFNEKAEAHLEKEFTCDWIYLDPDRRGDNNRKLYALSDCEPDVLKLLNSIWQKAPSVLIKTSPMLDITEAVKQLNNIDSIHVVAVENEVKEVLYVLKREKNDDLIRINTINFSSDGAEQQFQFLLQSEKTINTVFSVVQNYLYEPNAAILKAGAFKSLTQIFPVYKLHPSSHLYTSVQPITDFPGRIFKVKKVVPFQKKQLIGLLSEKKANVTVRNFPISVEEIRKKTGIKEGGSQYLFATTDVTDKNIVVFCEKLS